MDRYKTNQLQGYAKPQLVEMLEDQYADEVARGERDDAPIIEDWTARDIEEALIVPLTAPTVGLHDFQAMTPQDIERRTAAYAEAISRVQAGKWSIWDNIKGIVTLQAEQTNNAADRTSKAADRTSKAADRTSKAADRADYADRHFNISLMLPSRAYWHLLYEDFRALPSSLLGWLDKAPLRPMADIIARVTKKYTSEIAGNLLSLIHI